MAEQRLIDANKLREQCDAPHWCVWMSDIDDAPTIDAVPVVRCKDCDLWREELKVGYAGLGNEVAPCEEWSDQEDGRTRYTKPTDFCSYGERRVDDMKGGDWSD